jgi:assimilatory nitrate reductase electron transfer subunit
MAGARLAEEIAERDTEGVCSVVLIGAEPHLPYNRVLLTEMLSGELGYRDIVMTDPGWYLERGYALGLGISAESVDPRDRLVGTSDGMSIAYDVLVLATGADPIFPPLEGLTIEGGDLRPGVFAFRTLDDCRALRAAQATAKEAVVIGGGVLGLEAAGGLAARGMAVTIVHAAAHLMDRQLDAAAARILRRSYRDLGITSLVDTRAKSVVARADGAVGGVVLSDGGTLPADVVVVSCGVRPRVALAERCGLKVEQGIVVGDDLRTSDPLIYAIGDCAQHRNINSGLLDPAWDQARVLGARITGTDRDVSYTGSTVVTRLKANVDLTAMGDAGSEPEDAEVVIFSDAHRGTYKKLVIVEGRIAGAILLGDDATSGTVTQFFDRGTPVPEDPKILLFAGLRTQDAGTETIGDDVTICRCNAVTNGEIIEAHAQGATTVDDVSRMTRSSTGCGTCRSDIARILDGLNKATTAVAVE